MRVKMSIQPPPAPTASAVGPCPTVIQSEGRPETGSLPSTIAPPDHPRQDGKGLLRIHLWCLNHFPRLRDRIEQKYINKKTRYLSLKILNSRVTEK